MNFVDQTLIRFGHPPARSELFAQDALATLVHTTYGVGVPSEETTLAIAFDHVTLVRRFEAPTPGERPVIAEAFLSATVTTHDGDDTSAKATGTYPVSCAVMVRDFGTSLHEILRTADTLHRVVERDGAAGDHPFTVVWVTPERTFEDDNWPGTQSLSGSRSKRRLERLRLARAWLSAAGVCVATVG
ncbi:MAG: hypothetical protein AAGI01_12750 [Myxococcota bacterium]